MKSNRRKFLQFSALSGISFAGSANILNAMNEKTDQLSKFSPAAASAALNNEKQSIIGLYGPWATSENSKSIPSHSLRGTKWKNVDQWRLAAKKVTMERMAVPDIGKTPAVTVKKQYTYNGLHVEELTWQLPYGRPTDAILLKPADAKGPLPAILAFHDHGGNKYFGTRKITKTSDEQHPMMMAHQRDYYGGAAWANEIAKRGYVVLVPDAFTFGTRRVMLQDVPEHLRNGLSDENPEEQQNIDAYNKWASEHEHIMAKSLFCSGTTWPGVFFAEDRKALEILTARNDVDAKRIGCCGLSGGGLRTDFMAGLDDRIKCAVSVGFMSTWNDFALNKSYTHTWMVYVPLLPKELDFPEILGLRAPLPTLVLNDSEDQLYTIGQMQEADKILKAVFEKAGAPDRYKASFYPGPHKFDREMQKEAFEWFDRWLKA
jgi:dienelactone hydrolase